MRALSKSLQEQFCKEHHCDGLLFPKGHDYAIAVHYTGKIMYGLKMIKPGKKYTQNYINMWLNK